MVRNRGIMAALLAAVIFVVPSAARAGDATQAEIEQLRQEIEGLRAKLRDTQRTVARSPVDVAVESKYGPDAAVTTKAGKLTISGLLQVWYYSIENDNRGIFDDPATSGIADTNEASDNDSFRIRRSQIKFTMDIHENITAVVMIDPAAEAASFPDLNSNQGPGGFARANRVAPEFQAVNGAPGSTFVVQTVQIGAGVIPTLLQDAFINYHGVVPHHDFTIGQFKPFFGEETVRSDAQLDFVERSFIGNRFNRDMGIQIHGSWWEDNCESGDGRFQYWLGVFNGAGNYHQSAGSQGNRSDDNDAKDFLGTVIVRPLWDNCGPWGWLELGYSGGFGKHGESGTDDPIESPLNGLNRKEVDAIRHAAWIWYRPSGAARGWWARGEWQYVRDKNAPLSVLDMGGAANAGLGDVNDGFFQSNGNTYTSTGWYVSTGYKLSESVFADCGLPSWLKPFEFALRYQQFENVEVADEDNPAQTDNYETKVITAGVNYYIKGHNAKIQANYNNINDPSARRGDGRIRSVDNDNFVVNFQVAF